jgi:hypothetical protein
LTVEIREIGILDILDCHRLPRFVAHQWLVVFLGLALSPSFQLENHQLVGNQKGVLWKDPEKRGMYDGNRSCSLYRQHSWIAFRI